MYADGKKNVQISIFEKYFHFAGRSGFFIQPRVNKMSRMT